jgi:hypothetical protein
MSPVEVPRDHGRLSSSARQKFLQHRQSSFQRALRRDVHVRKRDVAPCTLDDHRPGGGSCELRQLDRPPSGPDQRSDLVGAAPAVLGPSDPRRHVTVRLLNEDHIRLLLLRRLL